MKFDIFHCLSRLRPLFVYSSLFVLTISTQSVEAHGFEGDRFFPPTITLDDPFAADDLAVTVSSFNNPANFSGGNTLSKTRQINLTTEFDKEIFPKFAIGIAKSYQNFQPDSNDSNSPSQGGTGQFAFDGFSNLQLSLKYQAYENSEHEAILSLGTYIDCGGTGHSKVFQNSNGGWTNANSSFAPTNAFTTFSPTVWWGKGFGDLPDSVRYFRPIAITGVVSQVLLSESSDGFGDSFSNSLNWGFSLEYSLIYLEQNVEDVGIPAPFRNMIPCVEFALNTPENSQQSLPQVTGGASAGTSRTTSTINPGIMWEGKYCQVGAEALIPMNSQTGPDVGGVFQVHIYIDDIFPSLFGHPLFFGKQIK